MRVRLRLPTPFVVLFGIFWPMCKYWNVNCGTISRLQYTSITNDDLVECKECYKISPKLFRLEHRQLDRMPKNLQTSAALGVSVSSQDIQVMLQGLIQEYLEFHVSFS